MWVGDILAVQNKSLDWNEIELHFETEIFELVTIKKVFVIAVDFLPRLFYHKKLKQHMEWGCVLFCWGRQKKR